MINFEELLSLANLAGLEARISRTSLHNTNTDAVVVGGGGERSFSVCVAALPHDAADRFRPFNAKSYGERETVESDVLTLREAARALEPDGLLFIYGLPGHLARYAAALYDELTLRYWIAIRTLTRTKPGGLRPEHTGLLLLSRPGAALNRVRIPHAECRSCGQPLKDWGGKSHLMHPEGVALSDVWMDIVVDPENRLPSEVFERILQLCSGKGRSRLLLLVPDEPPPYQLSRCHDGASILAFNPLKWRAQDEAPVKGRLIPHGLVDTLHKAPCLDVLRMIPSETVDLAFADPPFNLTKNYNGYSDDRSERDYVGWCKRWLVEYERVLKPGGAMFILNLPRWSALLADFLGRSGKLYLQNWIVWNSLPEPKGVLMPAHYALLYFTKGKEGSRFNYCSMENGWEPFDEAVFPPDRADVCQRRACVRKRRASGKTWRGELTDVWHDIHRERRRMKGASQSRAHPCVTPERLIDRIIRLTTDPGNVVLDAFAGTGTTALVARRLGRRFIAIEQDDDYLGVANRRVTEYRTRERVARPRMTRRRVSKRALQIELQRLALALGRLPTKADAEVLSRYKLSAFEDAFDSWGEAVKAAKTVAGAAASHAHGHTEGEQLDIFEPGEIDLMRTMGAAGCALASTDQENHTTRPAMPESNQQSMVEDRADPAREPGYTREPGKASGHLTT
ncbi:MAG TPA: DNA methyltransferase [Blastocatellia bacterium]|jgi:site-specific DNA-methyltransferase (adenine-specific)